MKYRVGPKCIRAQIVGLIVLTVIIQSAARSNDGKYNSTDEAAATGPALCKEFVGSDFNNDCFVDLIDYGLFQRCVTGPNLGPPSIGCEGMDLDGDDDVDESDFTDFPQCISGLHYVAESACEDPAYTPPTSLDRINDELAAGLITEIEALRYSVFDVFGDSRLPSRFYGAPYREGTFVTQQLAEQYGALPADAQDELRPFLLPPDAPGSWYQLSAQTASTSGGPPTGSFDELDVIDGTGTSVAVVKWPAAFPLLTSAQTVRDALGGANGAYETLVSLMGRDPISDANLGAENNGGDGRYDVYLLPIASSNFGWMSAHSSALFPGMFVGTTRPSFIVVNVTLLADRFSGDAFIDNLNGTIAHEFMHVIQFAFDVKRPRSEYTWIDDATANWAEHYVFPNGDSEQLYAHHYLKTLDVSLEIDKGKRRYGGYLYFLHHVNKHNTDILPLTYESAESVVTASTLKAINSAVPGGIADNWAEFAVANWNDWKNPPVDGYQAADNLEDGARDYTVGKRPELGGSTQGSSQMELKGDGLEPLSAQYFRYVLSEPDTRSIMFANGLTFKLERGVPAIFNGAMGDETYHSTFLSDAETNRLHVMALIKQNGNWLPDPIDLTKVAFAPFCQEAASESIEEIVFIMANARFEDSERDPVNVKGLTSRLFISNIGCGAWEGTARNVYQVDNLPDELTTSTTDFTQIEFTRDTLTLDQIAAGAGQTMFGPPRFGTTVIPASVFGGLSPQAGGYRLTKVVAPWSHISSYEAGSSNCRELGSGTMQLTDAFQGTVLTISPFVTATRSNSLPSIFRSFFISLVIVDADEIFDGVCVDEKGTSTFYDSPFGASLLGGYRNMEFGPLFIHPSGNRINQSWTVGNNSYQIDLQSKNIP